MRALVYAFSNVAAMVPLWARWVWLGVWQKRNASWFLCNESVFFGIACCGTLFAECLGLWGSKHRAVVAGTAAVSVLSVMMLATMYGAAFKDGGGLICEKTFDAMTWCMGAGVLGVNLLLGIVLCILQALMPKGRGR